MSKFKNFDEFRKQFKGSIGEHVFLYVLTQIREEKGLVSLKDGFDLKLKLNGEEYEFTDVIKRVDIHFDELVNEVKEIQDSMIEKKFKEKINEKIYGIIDQLDYIDNIIKKEKRPYGQIGGKIMSDENNAKIDKENDVESSDKRLDNYYEANHNMNKSLEKAFTEYMETSDKLISAIGALLSNQDEMLEILLKERH